MIDLFICAQACIVFIIYFIFLLFTIFMLLVLLNLFNLCILFILNFQCLWDLISNYLSLWEVEVSRFCLCVQSLSLDRNLLLNRLLTWINRLLSSWWLLYSDLIIWNVCVLILNFLCSHINL